MKSLSYCALSTGAAIAFLSGCAFRQAQNDTGAVVPPAGAASASSEHDMRKATSSYQVLYRFVPPSGREPLVGLTDVDGMLYGTAYEGGLIGCHHQEGCGTVYTFTTSGAEKSIFSFDARDGVNPESPLIAVNGTLYGTTYGGYGTFYSITASGSEMVLHQFHLERSDGQNPLGSLLDLNGTLYGTTSAGGHIFHAVYCKIGCGTIYSITTAGDEKVLYRFKGGPDGDTPVAGLIDVKGTLYGTTLLGGNGTGCVSSGGCGTVYGISPQGSYKQLYSFAGGSDGANPSSALLDVNGTLYGTTRNGGGTGCGGHGCGTVFTVTASGKERVLYSFAGGSDGQRPLARVIEVKGTLYGTTSEGGGGTACEDGCGTVYSITPAGEERVLYSFAGVSDGSSPQASLIDIKGTLYGTTASGGDSKRKYCCGTIFAWRL